MKIDFSPNARSSAASFLYGLPCSSHSPTRKFFCPQAWGCKIAYRFGITHAVDVQGFGFDYRYKGTPRKDGFDARHI